MSLDWISAGQARGSQARIAVSHFTGGVFRVGIALRLRADASGVLVLTVEAPDGRGVRLESSFSA